MIRHQLTTSARNRAASAILCCLFAGMTCAQVMRVEGESAPFLNDSHATAGDHRDIGNFFVISGSYIAGDPNGDKDYYMFNGDSGATLDIDMTITMPVTTTSQPYQEILFLFDSAEQLVAAWNTSSAYAGMASIGIETYTLPATDTYTIAIAEWSVAPNALTQPGITFAPLSTRGFSATGATPDSTFNTAGGNQIAGTLYDVTVTVSSGNDPNSPSCAINAPLAAAMVSGAVAIDFDADDPQSDPVTATFEFSTDMGATWTPCTAHASSLLPNPAPGITTPASGLVFQWDSVTAGVGLVTPEAADLRLTLDDGTGFTGDCSVAGVLVDNVVPPPSCTATGPAAPSSGDISIQLDLVSPSAGTVDVTMDYSIDAGATWLPATAAPGSPIGSVASGVPTGATSFLWASRTDGVGSAAPVPGVLVRATVDDGVAPLAGACITAGFEVDNTALCGGICGDCNVNSFGPDIVDALAAAQISAGLSVPTMLQMGCCDVNSSSSVDIIDALFIAQASAGLPVPLGCP